MMNEQLQKEISESDNSSPKPEKTSTGDNTIIVLVIEGVLALISSLGDPGLFILPIIATFILFITENIFIGTRIHNKWKINKYLAWFGSLIFNIIGAFILGASYSFLTSLIHPFRLGDSVMFSLLVGIAMILAPQVILIIISRPK